MNNIEKFAIVADLHANKYAMEVFFDYIDSNFSVDLILNCGDNVNIGPHPKEIVSEVLNDKRFINILGNNDQSLWKLPPVDIMRAEEITHHHWTRAKVGEELIELMKEIPKTHELTINGKRIFMVHSRIPQNPIWDLPLLYTNVSVENFVKDYPSNVDNVLLGHTHEQLLLNWGSQKFINPGSLGCSRGKAVVSFCLVDTSSPEVNIEFKNLPYNEKRLKDDMKRLDMPDRDNILNSFYENWVF
ncbi:MAG: metallophosphoesterase family protein [Candidatus Heimdallarchaeota archaeon]